MKKTLLRLITGIAMGGAVLTAAADAVSPSLSLTPVPASMKTSRGEFMLPDNYTVGVSQSLPADFRAEADKFVSAVNKATGYKGTVTSGAEATVTVMQADGIAPEGYNLKITADGVELTASTADGLFFGFQTVKKLLPPNVMAGVADSKVTEYPLPLVDIKDSPRFEYRGFELDCARHFHSLEEIKRMLDVMSYYKMNRFHWHLTDDQGWRVEIEKYPKLIEKATTAPNAYWYDFDNKYQYYTNEPYGPYYYTKADMREIVEYARNLHIEVLPEIEMPGHMVAAINAYPEFSCTPEGDHSIWYIPGISSDVLNVASPAVVQFCRDVLTEVAEIFPYEYVHIGGDETPTSAWQNNAECQALMAAEGMTSPHQLQSRFSKQMADHLKTLGKKVVCWNEVITASGADTKLAQDADMMIYGWLSGGSDKAVQLGLKTVWCHTGYYYLDYGQSNDPSEPRFMGGAVPLDRVYNVEPMSSGLTAEQQKLYLGVNGNLWCEYVAEPRHVEYMALPRLIAIAETGWSPAAKKNFTSFQKRFNNDTTLLNYNNYEYGRHFILGNSTTPTTKVMPEPDKWYRLITRVSHDSRSGRVLERVAAGSVPATSLGAPVNGVWTGVEDADNENQLWRFDEDPSNPGVYAIVNKGAPNGSINPDAGSTSVGARWKYDNDKVNYNFVLGEKDYYGEVDGAYYYSIRSNSNDGFWLNCGQQSANFAVNCWSNPADGNGGLWLVMPEDGVEQPDTKYPSFEPVEPGSYITLTNTTDKYAGMQLADDMAEGPYAGYTDSPFGAAVWRVESATVNADNSQTLTLYNPGTGRALGAPVANAVSTMATGFFSGNLGYPVQMATSAAEVTVYRNEGHDDYTVAIKGKNLYPIPERSQMLPGIISSGSTISGQNPGRTVGGTWMLDVVEPIEYVCTDTDGNVLMQGWRVRSDAASASAMCPKIENYELTDARISENVLRATYKRVGVHLSFDARDALGARVNTPVQTHRIGESFSLSYPEVKFYTLTDSEVAAGTEMTLTEDRTIGATYTTDALNGVYAVGDPVSEIEDGHSYLIYDAHESRFAYRGVHLTDNKIYGTKSVEGTSPVYAWVFEADGKNYLIRNLANGLYVPALVSGTNNPMTENGEPFRLSYNKSSETWTIRGTSNSLYWNGNDGAALEMAGWSDGHPYKIFEYVADPCFRLEFICADEDGNELQHTSTIVNAGRSYIWAAPEIKGYSLKSVEGYDAGFNAIEGHKKVIATYTDNSDVDLPVVDPDPAATQQRDAIYDLQGRRVHRVTTPGLYIVNGQKLYVR